MKAAKEIRLHSFTNHESTSLIFPQKGLVLITGDNGSGKSSIPEAIAALGWNENLRGKPGWNTQSGRSEVHAWLWDDMHITRGKGRQSSLTFTLPGNYTTPTYETPTKAQEELEKLIGSFKVWRRTSVFLTSDVDTFTQAPDGDRKRLIESITGLDAFDEPSKACRKDIRDLQTELEKAQNRIKNKEIERDRMTEHVQDMQAIKPRKAVEIDIDDVKTKLGQLNNKIKKIRPELYTEEQKKRELQQKIADAKSEIKSNKTRRKLFEQEKCSVCEQKIDATFAEENLGTLDRLNEVLSNSVKQWESDLYSHDAKASTLSKEIFDDTQLALKLEKSIKEYAEAKEESNDHTDKLRELKKKLEDVEDALVALKVSEEDKQREMTLLKTVDRSLSLTGVRAHILQHAIGAIERISNMWLAKVGLNKMKLTLSPFKEKTDGGVTEKIQLEVQGAGGGYGYKATSGGERRRIDIAIMLGLAELQEATFDKPSAQLWFDEVFDALDTTGTEAVIDVLTELAKDKSIVVITHNEEIQRRLQPLAEKWYRFEEGKVAKT